MSQFCHLHLHTQFSVLDGAIKIHECIQCAKELGQTSVAMTDHGNMHGAIEFYQEATKSGIKPIIGCEVYIAPISRFDRTAKDKGGRIHHLTLLAKNNVGYRNLCKMVSAAYIEGFYHKPRVDFDLLQKHHEGIICLSGCLAGEFANFALQDDLKGATAHIEKYSSLFGEDYFLEIQPHQIPEQRKLNLLARELGKSKGIGVVATNDCHYLKNSDHFAQEVLMCISTGKLLSDPDHLKHDGLSLSFKSFDEMLEALPEEEEAIRQSVNIAERCNLDFDFKTYHMPVFNPPVELTIDDYFREQAKLGLLERFKELSEKDHRHK